MGLEPSAPRCLVVRAVGHALPSGEAVGAQEQQAEGDAGEALAGVPNAL